MDSLRFANFGDSCGLGLGYGPALLRVSCDETSTEFGRKAGDADAQHRRSAAYFHLGLYRKEENTF
jgi:hypothetical protein